MEKNNKKTTPDVERLFGASIQPEIFPPETLHIPTNSRSKKTTPPSMLAPYKIEPDFPDATELINEFTKIADEFKIDDSEVSNE
jgi:hypothetical protein